MASRAVLLASLLAAGLVVAACRARPAPVVAGAGTEPAEIWKVWRGDWVRETGSHRREVCLPGRDLSFTFEGEKLLVFRPAPGRYRREESTYSACGAGEKVAVLRHEPWGEGPMTPRKVADVMLTRAEVERLVRHLSEEEQLGELARRHLPRPTTPRPVARTRSENREAVALVERWLENTGLTSEVREGWVTFSVPATLGGDWARQRLLEAVEQETRRAAKPRAELPALDFELLDEND